MPEMEQLAFELAGSPVQRWRHHQHSFLRTSDGGFDRARYRKRDELHLMQHSSRH
jgi:hypothetical protein